MARLVSRVPCMWDCVFVGVVCLILTHDRICHRAQPSLVFFALHVLFMPWPAVVLMTGRGVFGFSLSNQGPRFYWEGGSAQILVCVCAPLRRLTYAPAWVHYVSVCVSHVSESNCAAPRSLLRCRDLIRVLADSAAHRSRQGCPHNPAQKFSRGCGVSVMPHHRNYRKRRPSSTFKCVRKHSRRFEINTKPARESFRGFACCHEIMLVCVDVFDLAAGIH